MAHDYGLPVAAVHSPFVPHVTGWPHDPLGRLQESVALAHAMGAGVVVAHLTLDTTRLGTWGLDPLAIGERLKERVIHVHLSNYNGQEHQLPQDGRLSLGCLLQRLSQNGYQGAVSLEFGPKVLQAEGEAQVRDHLRRAVRLFRQDTAG